MIFFSTLKLSVTITFAVVYIYFLKFAMKISHQQHLTNWFKIPVVAMYVLFFLVQFFFNSNVANRSNSNNLLSSTISAVTSVSTTVKAEKLPVKKLNVRLNKRFQPANVPVWNPFYIEIPQWFLEIKNGFVYSRSFISAYQAFAHTLRGPPNVA